MQIRHTGKREHVNFCFFLPETRNILYAGETPKSERNFRYTFSFEGRVFYIKKKKKKKKSVQVKQT